MAMKNKYKFKQSRSDKEQSESYYPFINSSSPVLFLEEGGNIYIPEMVPGKAGYITNTITQNEFTLKGPKNKKTSFPRGVDESGRGILSVGSKGEEVIDMQQFLQNKGFYKGEVDGIYGPKTKQAVVEYQKWYNNNVTSKDMPNSYINEGKPVLIAKDLEKLKEDGIVGDATRAALMWRQMPKPAVVPAPRPPAEPTPVGKSNRTYAATDETSNTSQLRGPIDMNYLDGLALTAAGIIGGGAMLAGAEALPALAPAGLGAAGRVLTREAVKQAPKIMTKEGIKQIPRTIPNTIPKGAPTSGGRFFQPRTPSSYGTRTSFEVGGMPQQQQQIDPKEILGMFLQTLSEEEQEQFIAELQQMQPEEQMQVVQAIYQKLQQEMQQPQMQQQMMSAQQGDIQMYKEGGTPRNGQTKRSTQKGKKMAVYMDGKWHHFGDSSMQDYRTHKSEKRRQAFYSRHKKNLQGDDPRSKAFRVYARKTWQEGGQTPNVMIEVEGGESVMLPNGELQRFEGPKHSEGGIPVTMPEGAKIYSEHLKAPKEVIELVLGKKTKKKYSYADLSKKFPTKPFEQKLQNPELDKYERQAALVKLENNRTMLETIFQAQETEKEMKNKKVQMSQNYSGMPMAQTGTVVKRAYTWFPENAPLGITNPSSTAHAAIVPEFPISPGEELLRNNSKLGWSDRSLTTESLTPQQWAEMPAGQMKGAAPKQPATKPNATQGPVAPRVSPSSTTPRVSRAPQGSGTSTMYSPEMQEYIKRAGPGAYEAYIPNPNFSEIPNVQSNRGNRIYGTQDWSEEQRMNDFKKRHRRFFEQEGNQNWDPKKQGDTRKFQEWYEAEAKREGTPSYFTGKQNFNKIDDKFGQYTWSAPSFDRVMSDEEPPSLEDAPAELGTQRSPLEPTYNPEEVIEAVDPGKEYLSQGPFIPAPLPPAKKKFGISRQLSGSIFDALMAASNRLNVDEPQYRDNRKYPLFTRFVDFEDKEVGKNYNLAMQQIMNSNMPEQAKQAQIANLNAKLQDYQGKQDLQRNQLYQQKLMQDTEKLQGYMDRNVDQATADLENYRMKKARIEDLKNQFRAKRKADIVNPIRQYLDFVQEVDLQNQIYSDNFRMNPFTGKVDFYQSTPDALAKTESQMAQYRNNTQFSPIPGGGQYGNLGGVPVYIDPEGRMTIITNTQEPTNKKQDSRALAGQLYSKRPE